MAALRSRSDVSANAIPVISGSLITVTVFVLVSATLPDESRMVRVMVAFLDEPAVSSEKVAEDAAVFVPVSVMPEAVQL